MLCVACLRAPHAVRVRACVRACVCVCLVAAMGLGDRGVLELVGLLGPAAGAAPPLRSLVVSGAHGRPVRARGAPAPRARAAAAAWRACRLGGVDDDAMRARGGAAARARAQTTV